MPGAYGYGWDAANNVWRKILVNADGKLIIDPTEIFEDVPTDNEHGKAPTSDWAHDHAADPAAHHTPGIPTGTYYWTCAGVHFDAELPYTNEVQKYEYGQLHVCYGSRNLEAAVILPFGGTIEAAVVYGNSTSQNSIWYLRRIEIATGNYSALAGAYVGTEDTTISNPVINNQLYGYYIYIHEVPEGGDIWGARIRFTI